ncbi:hypothetical protein TNCV_2745981 [Trichonephila clavipes]|nr:hypothetical protein TNCV_2745981 [Trichonephila clavipes]
MNCAPSIANAASVVAQSKKDRVPGDLNAKHPIWGCSTANLREKELLDIIDDKCFSILNDGTATHFSYSYNTKEGLDISIPSSDLGSSCKWTLLENLGSDHLPILMKLKKRQLVPTSNNKQRVFKKTDWQSFAEAVDNGIKSIPFKDSVDLNCKSPLLQPLLEERKSIFENRDTGISNHVRTELNKINATVKRLHAQIKRDKWNDLCSGLDSRTSNRKLWKLLKDISNEQLQAEQCNTILSEDGNLAVNDEQAADLLGLHYQKISRLNFSVEDRNIKIRASRIVHGCRSDTHRGTSIFSRDFRVNELEAAIGDSCLNKSPGPDGIHSQMIDHLDLSGRQRLLDIINCSWSKGDLLLETGGERSSFLLRNVAKLMVPLRVIDPSP